MARQSAASLSVVPIGIAARLAPPSKLTREEKALWSEVVNSKPVDWFGEDSSPLLAEYVRAACMCDRLALQIEAAMTDPEAVGALKAYLDMRDKESKRVLSNATKLRLTQQSRYTPQAAATANKKASGGAKPWQSASA